MPRYIFVLIFEGTEVPDSAGADQAHVRSNDGQGSTETGVILGFGPERHYHLGESPDAHTSDLISQDIWRR